MGDEEGGVPYSWTSTEPLMEGAVRLHLRPLAQRPFGPLSPALPTRRLTPPKQEEAPSGPWVKGPGKAKVAYPNGDAFEGAFNEALQKHGRGVYIWGTAVGNNPWVPEEGFPGACFFPRAMPPLHFAVPSPPPFFFSPALSAPVHPSAFCYCTRRGEGAHCVVRRHVQGGEKGGRGKAVAAKR